MFKIITKLPRGQCFTAAQPYENRSRPQRSNVAIAAKHVNPC